MVYQFILGGLSFACAASILVLVRKRLLHPLHAVWWLGVAGTMLLAGLFPRAVDAMGYALGGISPLILFLSIAVVVMLIRILLSDLEHCKMLGQQRRMNQHLACLGLRLRQLEEGKTPARQSAKESKPAPRANTHE